MPKPPLPLIALSEAQVAIAAEQGWKPPGYARVRQIIKVLSPVLVTFAHKGAEAYREEFDLLYLVIRITNTITNSERMKR